MRGRLLLLLALAVAPALPRAARAQAFTPQIPRECPDLGAALAAASAAWRLVCAANVVLTTNLAPFEYEQVGALAVDRDGAVRGLITRDEQPSAATYDGPMASAGSSDDTIFWGAWSNGTAELYDASGAATRLDAGMPIRYVGGVPPSIFFREDMLAGRFGAGPLPTAGVADYDLLGAVEVLSSSASSGRPGRDGDGNVIAPAAVTRAQLRVDFAARTASLEIDYALRGSTAHVTVPLRPSSALSATYAALDCEGEPAHCATAELHFYGRQGAFAGVRFTASTETSLPESARVAARLQNVRSNGSLAFRRP